MKRESIDPGKSEAAGLAPREIRTCPTCGTKFSATSDRELCPVCLLLGAAGGGSASAEALSPATSSERSSAETESVPIVRRFENYEVMLDQAGRPIELGRGAMGITYKAFDIDLRCPVTLKVISEKYVGDESARLRFLREARAAAKARHPNVASVFHLGRIGGEYFYAMEFVEGETLENLIRRSGRLKTNMALEITAQVAAGLAAVHKQKLVHRDIKPSNIMVSFEEGGAVAVKIIDLGLAKTVNEPGSQTAISIPGSFAGTPEFASPEQFTGVGVDIRSDLYSLGVVLWEMVTSKTPFRGTPGEVMHQHQHAPLPLKQLADVPQPVVVLLEVLLEKDPRRRLQRPSKILEVLPIITDAMNAGIPINPRSLRELPDKQATARLKAAEHLRAHDLYHRGIALMELLDPEVNQKAGELFKKVTEQEPSFALGYVGLACFYLEQEGFHGEKRLLDSAVESARRAVALDPLEVRGYTALARAFHRKGWYSQCDDALRKALELGPDDDTANALAAIRAIARHEFFEAYQLFRKAYFLNPKETWRVYFAAEILFHTGMTDLAEKWMQRALDQETSPQLHHLMECYRMTWRRRYTDARAGFLQLPAETHLAPRLQSTVYSVSDGLLYCAIGLEDWAVVIETCSAQLDSAPENFWARTYLALALQRMDRQTEARATWEELLSRGLERLERPAQPENPWDVSLYVAWACRCVGRQREAYRYLNQYVTHRTFLHLPLGLDNPILDAFKSDHEFNTILADLKQKLEAARRAIREYEATTKRLPEHQRKQLPQAQDRPTRDQRKFL